MPEVVTKFPEVTLKLLNDAGAVCGEGAPQRILTACSPERFCSLPTGEMCVYGLNEIPQMTQISVAEIAQVVAGVPLQAPIFSLEVIYLIIIAFVVGVAFGLLLCKKASKKTKK